MPRHVLVAYDESPQAKKALDLAIREFGDAKLSVLHIIDPAEAGSGRRFSLPTFPQEWYENAREDANRQLAEASDLATEAGLEVETAVVVGRTARSIVEYAEENDCDHIVTGSHGRSGVSRILLGSVAETVIRRSPVPVTVVR
ncbi:universal stress protein [Haloarchaeobius sp. HRN-SO-5]|uniref:universal stress protein n=1 Tax=Haloarchaeobius sp. HRN-SO-5 TaxID=3446118 RepID=UPI003EBEF787